MCLTRILFGRRSKIFPVASESRLQRWWAGLGSFMDWLRPCKALRHNSELESGEATLKTPTIKFSTKPRSCSSETCFIHRGADTRRYFLLFSWKQNRRGQCKQASPGLQCSEFLGHRCVRGQTVR